VKFGVPKNKIHWHRMSRALNMCWKILAWGWPSSKNW